MQEIYVSLGPETSWVNAALMIAIFAAACLVRSIRAKQLKLTAYEGGIIGWNCLVWAIAVPFSIWVSMMFAIALTGAFVSHNNAPSGNRRVSLILGAVAVIFPLGGFLGMMNLFEHRIELADERVSETQFHRVLQVPRKGLQVHATSSTNRGWLANRQWWSWTTFSGDDLGPDLAGFEVFLGPHGFIRGDDLGRHLALWADTSPVYRRYDR